MKKDLDKMIENALKSELKFKLSRDFGRKTLNAIKRKETIRLRKMYTLISFGTLLMMAIGVVNISYFLPEVLQRSFLGDSSKEIESLIPIAVLIGVMLVIIQFLDKKLIKDRSFPG